MREVFFILVVVAILFGLTAIRYRRQIAGLIGLAKMLKDAKNAAGQSASIDGEKASVQLVNCVNCGVWLPINKAIKSGSQSFYCSETCETATTPAA